MKFGLKQFTYSLIISYDVPTLDPLPNISNPVFGLFNISPTVFLSISLRVGRIFELDSSRPPKI